jgi:hypothetical protein
MDHRTPPWLLIFSWGPIYSPEGILSPIRRASGEGGDPHVIYIIDYVGLGLATPGSLHGSYPQKFGENVDTPRITPKTPRISMDH